MVCGLLVDLNLVCSCQSQQKIIFFHQSYCMIGIIFLIPYKTPTSSDSLDCEELLLDMSHGRSEARVEYVNAYIFSLISLNDYNAKFVTRIVFFKF
jgi:hypothetical protein